MVKSLYRTRPGEQETLYYQGQPVVELREEVQDILDDFAQTHPDFPLIYLAEPVLGRDGTTDWYGQAGDTPFAETEKEQAWQAYQAVRGAILSWAQTRPKNIDSDLLEILPLALMVPSADFLQRKAKNSLVLTAWGHRSLTGWLEKGNVFGNVPMSEQKAAFPATSGLAAGVASAASAEKFSQENLEKTQNTQAQNDSEKVIHPEAHEEEKEPVQEEETEEVIEEVIENKEERAPRKKKIIYEKEVRYVPQETEIWWRRSTVFWPISGILLTCFMVGMLLLALSLGSGFALFLFPLAILCLLIWLVGMWLRKFWGWIFAGLGIALLVVLLFWLLFNRSLFFGQPSAIVASPVVATTPVETVAQTPLPEKEVPLTETKAEDASQLLDRSHEVGGASGAMEIVLSWEGPDDLDLHVFPPNGVEISFTRPQSDGGALDVDANANPSKMQAHPLEHVTWTDEPPVGGYSLTPVFYRSRNNGQPVPYHLDVYSHGKLSHEYHGTLAHQGDRDDFGFDIFPPDQKEGAAPKAVEPVKDVPDVSDQTDTPALVPETPKEEVVAPAPVVKKIIHHVPPPVTQEEDVQDVQAPEPAPASQPSQPKWDIQGTVDHAQNSFGSADVPQSSGLAAGVPQSSGLVVGAQGKTGSFGKGGDGPPPEHSKGWEFSHRILGMKSSD